MPSTLTEMISMIQFRLGNRKDLATQIEREIQLAQIRLEDSPDLEPWFLVQQDETIAVTSGVQDITLPAGFLRMSEEEQPQILVDGIWQPLRRIQNDDGLSNFQGATGTPTRFTMFGDTFRLWPSPDKAYTVRLTYAARETSLDTTTPTDTNAWTENAFDVLMNKALIILAGTLQNKSALEMASSDFSSAYAGLQTQIVQREDANQTYQRMPGSGDQMTE